jgi:TolA-binding protein
VRRVLPHRNLLIALALTPTLSGCVSYWKGQDMEAETKAMQGQIEQMVEDHRTTRDQHGKTLAALDARVVTLEGELKGSLERLRSNSADSGLELQRLREELATLKGELETFRHKAASQPEDGLPNLSPPTGAPVLPDNPADLYRYGYERKQANDCPESIRAFVKLARDFADYGRADNGLALAAECQYAQQDYPGSLRTLKLITDKYPQGDKVDDALVLMHDNFTALGQCKQAVLFLESMINDHPTSNRIDEARRKLQETKRGCR